MPSRPAAYVLRCPMCGKLVPYRPRGPIPEGFPFCGPRCKMADLGKWLHEEYVLGRELTPEDAADAEDGAGLLRSTVSRDAEQSEEDDERVDQ